MENTEPIPVRSVSFKRKVFELHNESNNSVSINPFSSEYSKTNQDDDFEEVGLIRLQFSMSHLDFLIRPFKILGKKFNPSSYFSIYQFQSTIIDIPFSCKLKDIGLEIPLEGTEKCVVSLFEGNDGKYTQLNSGTYAVAVNNSSESIEVNILDLIKNKNLPEGIEVINNEFNEGDESKTFKLLRVLTKNTSNLVYIIYVDGILIRTASYLTANQYQSGIVDIDKEFDLSTIKELKTTIFPNTKIMYHFM